MRFRILSDLWGYALETKKIWLFMLITFLLFIGIVIVVTESVAVMPWIYSFF